jgi:hypothetical protein
MRRIEIVARKGADLYGELVRKERELRQRNKGTFRRSGRVAGGTRWVHKAYPGWIAIRRGDGGTVEAVVRTRAGAAPEWQIAAAFLGFVDRHFGAEIAALHITYGA